MVRAHAHTERTCPPQPAGTLALATARGRATAACYAFAQVRLPACFKVSTWKPGPEPREKSESAPLIDDDLPLHNFKSVTLFMRRRSAWLCVAGAVLAYFAFLPPLLVIVPLMTEQFCTEWHAGTGVVITLQSNGAIAPECMAGWKQSPRAAAHGRRRTVIAPFLHGPGHHAGLQQCHQRSQLARLLS
jgi:hypothetical protein